MPSRLADLAQRLARHHALDRLREVEQRHHRRAPVRVRVARHDRRRASSEHGRLEHGHQRSTPPITGSSDAIAAIDVGDEVALDHRRGSAWRFTNEGSRIFTRYGPVTAVGHDVDTRARRAATRRRCRPRPRAPATPCVTILKWWIRASIDSSMMWRRYAGSLPIPSGPDRQLRRPARPSGPRSSPGPAFLEPFQRLLGRSSATRASPSSRTRYRAYASASVRVGTSKSNVS